MGNGKARFGQKGQKTPKIENLGLKVCSLGSRGDPHLRARGNPHGARGNPGWELEATRKRSSRQPVRSSSQPAVGYLFWRISELWNFWSKGHLLSLQLSSWAYAEDKVKKPLLCEFWYVQTILVVDVIQQIKNLYLSIIHLNLALCVYLCVCLCL